MLLDMHHILTFFPSQNMFKFILVFLFVQRVVSTNEQTLSISKHPLFTKILGLLDQLLLQVRKMQTLMIRTYSMIDHIPNDLRPFFAECFTAIYNTSRIQYSLKLDEAKLTRIPQLKTQLKQATTLEQQLNIVNITDRIVADITLNIVKPSMLFITEILDCIKNKTHISMD